MKKSLITVALVVAALAAAAAAHAFGIDPAAVLSPDVMLGLAGVGVGGMTTKAYQTGDVIDWVNGSGGDVTANSVVKMGNILGVALADIASGATGSVAVSGVFTVPKVTAAVIAQGDSLTWDVSVSKFDDNAATPASGDVTGAPAVAFEAGTSSMTELKVMFTGVPGTVTA